MSKRPAQKKKRSILNIKPTLLAARISFEIKKGKAGEYRMETSNIADYIDFIKNHKQLKAITEKVRAAKTVRAKKNIKYKESQLCVLTASFKTNDSRTLENVEQYNGLIQFDLDKGMGDGGLPWLLAHPSLFLLDKSVGGQGWYALFNSWVTTEDEYRNVYASIESDLIEQGIKPDPAAKSPIHARFASAASPFLYVNPNAKQYYKADYTIEETINWIWNFTIKSDPLGFSNGNCHRFGFRLTSAMLEYGVPLEDAIRFQQSKGRESSGLDKIEKLYTERADDFGSKKSKRVLIVPHVLAFKWGDLHTKTEEGNKQKYSYARLVSFVSEQWRKSGLFKKDRKENLLFFNGVHWDKSTVNDLTKIIYKCEKTSRVEFPIKAQVVNFALAIYKDLLANSDELVRDKSLFCFKNGVLNTRTHEFNSHFSPLFPVTTQMDYNYDPDATAPTFIRFLCDAFGNDEAEVDRFLQAVGAVLDLKGRNVPYNPYIVAPAGSGKSTLIEILTAVFGRQNVSFVPLQMVCDPKGMSLDSFDNKIINFCSEMSLNKVNAEAFKRASTGEALAGRGGDSWHSYTSDDYGRLFIVGNSHMNITSNEAPNIKRRFKNQQFTFKDRTPLRGAKIDTMYAFNITRSELPGIFNLLLTALKKLQANNFELPETADAVRLMAEFMDSLSGLKEFIDEIRQEYDEDSEKDFNNRNVFDNTLKAATLFDKFRRHNPSYTGTKKNFLGALTAYRVLIKTPKGRNVYYVNFHKKKTDVKK